METLLGTSGFNGSLDRDFELKNRISGMLAAVLAASIVVVEAMPVVLVLARE
jgi:hypothetical protein